MASKSPTGENTPARPTAGYLFSGRELERDRLRAFFRDLTAEERRPEKLILNPYGISGIGKTALLQAVIAEPAVRALQVSFVDLDSDRWKSTTPVNQFL